MVCDESRELDLRRVLIIHQGALGDFILMTPVADGLHLLYPDARIDFCSKPEHISLLAAKPYMGASCAPDGPEFTPFFHEDLWREARVPKCLQNAHAVFVFGQTGSRPLAERLSMRLDHPVYWIKSFPGPGTLQPVSKFLIEQMNALGWPLQYSVPRIEPSETERAAVRNWLTSQAPNSAARPVLLHPGSGGRKKIWPLSKWWSLLQWLIQKTRPVLMVLGPADACLSPFAERAQSLGVHVIRGVSLARLAAFLSKSAVYVGNDSGVSHLAAATGVASVVVFGPTEPEIWAPKGPNVRIVRSCWDASENAVWDRDGRMTGLEPELEEALDGLIA